MVDQTLRNTLVLALMLSITPFAAAEKPAAETGPGYMPSLELQADPALESMTPVSALLSEKAQGPEKAAAPESPTPQAEKNQKAVDSKTIPVSHQPESAMMAEPAETPAVYRPTSKEIDEKNLKPVSYSPLPAVVVFPVIKHGNEKAFGDLPILFAREIALSIEGKAPETRVFHPVYTVDELRMRGLGHLYDKMMDYYLQAGRPEPRAIDYLLNQLTADGRPISRVVFVEADLDMTHAADPARPLEYVKAFMTDGQPKRARYNMRGRVQVFDATSPEYPELWAFGRHKVIDADMMFNVTPSVFQDSDSHRAFAKMSRQIGREIFLIAPKKVYLEPQYDLAVQGRVADEN